MTVLPLSVDYVVPDGHFDEVRTDDGALRQPWAEFAAAAELGTESLSQAEKRVARQIAENGVTYNVYATADGLERPWSLDVLPLIVEAREWEQLERGLRQRARLLNAVATDLYGPQILLREGLVPPALVFRHPGFLRACHGVHPADGVFLHLVAFDLARGADGSWRVIGTRTQAPSGVGYALENRAIMSRVLPDAFHTLHVRALSSFFRELRQMLFAGAESDGSDAPHVVVLTPGPYNETYFEHAYLARQLGFPLVEGGDLTVRDDRVFLKTVSGLRPVHAILRRLDDDYCDPLEMRSDSTLGIPGLLQAWRAGHVRVANAFGMGVLESPALLAFLPPICERLFGEKLETPAIATWWCGETAARDARRRLSEGVIKSAFAEASMEPVFLSDLDADARREWTERLGASPDAYVVEEFLPLSHAPMWHDGRLENRALMLRVFLLDDGAGDYHMMPGGLSRIAGEDRLVVSGQRGGSSKDTWVLSEVPVASPAPAERRAHLHRLHGEPQTSSRAAEHLFWLGRYAERSENAARLLRSVLSRLTDTDGVPAGLHPASLRACVRQNLIEQPSSGSAASAIVHELITGLVDRHARRSLAYNVEQTVRVASAVRDRLSTDNWRVLNQLLQLLSRKSHALDLDDGLELIDEALLTLVAVGGLEMAHMTRDDGWRFLSLGRHLERLHFVSSTLGDVAPERTPPGSGLLEWLLELSDSLLTYRVRHMQHPEWESVVDLMLDDERNPRSVRFQLAKLAKHVRLLPDSDLLDVLADVDRLLLACRSEGATGQPYLFDGGERRLDALLTDCQRVSLRLGSALSLRYFSHVDDVPRATVGI